MQGNENLNLDLNVIVREFSQRIAQLTTDLVVSSAVIAKMSEENEVLRRTLEGMRETPDAPVES
jgi:methanogenic corrinoid protein MtbC1